jgi:hypothetical protein
MARRAQACITHQGQPFSAFTVNKVGTLKVKVLCTRTFFLHNSVSVSNFLRGNRFRFVFFYHFTLNSQFQPVQIVFKCLGGLRLFRLHPLC